MLQTTRLLFLALLLLAVCPVICPCYRCINYYSRYEARIWKFLFWIGVGFRISFTCLYVRCLFLLARRSARALQGWVPRDHGWHDVSFFSGKGAFGRLVTGCVVFVGGALAGHCLTTVLWRLFNFFCCCPPRGLYAYTYPY